MAKRAKHKESVWQVECNWFNNVDKDVHPQQDACALGPDAFAGNLQYIWTEPNSILLVKAQGLLHNVTPLTQGVRNILKLIYTQTNEKTPLYHKEMKRFN